MSAGGHFRQGTQHGSPHGQWPHCLTCLQSGTGTALRKVHTCGGQTQAEAKELLPGCLSSTGITTLELTRDFQVLGAHACDNCKLLKQVDISNSSIEEIQEFTFVHCASLYEVRLPYSLHTIRVKAFTNCAALPELAIPPSLHYIASRAFLDCTSLRRLTKLPGLTQRKMLFAMAGQSSGCT